MEIMEVDKEEISADVLSRVEREIADAINILLLLWDEGLTELHDRFLKDFVNSRGPKDLIIFVQGESIKDLETLYSQLREVVPLADYMGSSLDAMEDILRVEALAEDTTSNTYWIWRNAHVLYSHDSDSFRKAFEVMASCAREASQGFVGAQGEVVPPWSHWTPQPVSVLLTGSWNVLGAEAAQDDSFLYRFPENYGNQFPDLSTRLKAVRITR